MYLNLNVHIAFDPGMVEKSVLYMTRRHYDNGPFCACHSNKVQKTARQSLWSRTSSFLTEFLPDDLHAMTKLSSKD